MNPEVPGRVARSTHLGFSSRKAGVFEIPLGMACLWNTPAAHQFKEGGGSLERPVR
jgi:hypothetical protein